jgi:hypothetical protein
MLFKMDVKPNFTVENGQIAKPPTVDFEARRRARQEEPSARLRLRAAT